MPLYAHPTLRYLILGICLATALLPQAGRAIILYGTNDPGANTTAPTGMYADSGWDFLGAYGTSLGTMIAPQYFITAQHTGPQGGTFISTAGVNYTIDAAANGGVGYWDIAGTDLRVVKIQETFSAYATLYTGSDEASLEMITFGRGGPRGSNVMLGGELKGWRHSASDGAFRWGTNDLTGVSSSSMGSLLTAAFNTDGGPNEATFSAGDSGGGLFVLDGGQWKLAGVNYGTDGLFDFNDIVDPNEFPAALFDMGGFYVGNDDDGWTEMPDGVDMPSRLYASRISEQAAMIQAIVSVPEPGSALLVLAAALIASVRRRPAGRPKSAVRC